MHDYLRTVTLAPKPYHVSRQDLEGDPGRAHPVVLKDPKVAHRPLVAGAPMMNSVCAVGIISKPLPLS
jgi:hypothetical protein